MRKAMNPLKYDLDVSIEPAKHYLHVKGRIEGIDGALYLNENFTLLHTSSNGQNISCSMDREQPHPPFDMVSRPITFGTSNDTVEIEYEGVIAETIAEINQIDAHTVELASYSGWYPKPKILNTLFDFAVNLHLPKGYEIASNGRCMENGCIVSAAPSDDIVIFASDQVERFAYQSGNVRCTFLCPSDMLGPMEHRAKELVWANNFFTEKYGALDTDGGTEIVSVFRPSDGWGYKRGNASFVSSDWGRADCHYQGDFHELAHGWWGIANITKDDWINEGGAEFSAFSAARQLYGLEYAEKKYAEYLAEIEKVNCNVSIVDTDNLSEYRYLNHYIKTTVMFVNAQKNFGEEKVFGLLRDVFQQHKGNRSATTEGFLSLCGDMRPFFEKYLFAADWKKLDYHK